MPEQKSPALLDRFCTHLAAVERRSHQTVATYRQELRHFLEYSAENGLEIPSLTEDHIAAYLVRRRQEDNIGPRSTAKAISCLRSFFRFAIADGVRSGNPAALLESPRKRQSLPETMDRETVESILALMDTGTALGLRDRALFEMIYSSGLRISEAAGLDMRDIDFKESVVRVMGKGGKERLAVFGREAAVWLKRYIAESRSILAGGRGSALFVGRSGKRLSRKGIWKNYANMHTYRKTLR